MGPLHNIIVYFNFFWEWERKKKKLNNFKTFYFHSKGYFFLFFVIISRYTLSALQQKNFPFLIALIMQTLYRVPLVFLLMNENTFFFLAPTLKICFIQENENKKNLFLRRKLQDNYTLLSFFSCSVQHTLFFFLLLFFVCIRFDFC